MSTPLLISLFITLSVQLSLAQTMVDSSLMAYYQKTIKTLADDSMMGRPVSSVYEKKASEYILKEFQLQKKRKAGIQVFSYKQPDSLNYKEAVNVYCFINNHQDSCILLGAHFDHIGMGGPLSRSLSKPGIHNGADDNASGIALLLGLYRNYPSWKNPKYNYIFVAYSAHEIGLLGAAQFFEFVQSNYKPISRVFNFDMVGRMHPEEQWLKLIGVETDKTLVALLEAENSEQLRFRYESDYLLMQTDSKIYYQQDIPAISLTTGIHDDYHKLSDDEEKINYRGILSVQRLLEQVLKRY